MSDKKPLVNNAGNAVEIATGDTIPVANGGTGATTKGGAVANLLAESVTIANCANTTTETTLLSVTIPANTWANGEEIALFGVFTHRQFSGGAVNLTFKAKVAGVSVVTMKMIRFLQLYSIRSLCFLRYYCQSEFASPHAISQAY